MKYSIDFTNRFKKSLRKGVKRGLDPTLIEKAVEKLANEGKLPPSYKSHKLHGNLEGIWECHITPDWLMLWEQNDEKLTLLFLTMELIAICFDYDILNFRMWFKYGLRASAPSGRVGRNLRDFNYESTLKSSFWFFSLQHAI